MRWSLTAQVFNRVEGSLIYEKGGKGPFLCRVHLASAAHIKERDLRAAYRNIKLQSRAQANLVSRSFSGEGNTAPCATAPVIAHRLLVHTPNGI